MGFHWIQWDVVPQFDGIPLDSVGWGSTGFSGMGFHWVPLNGVPLDSVGWG